MTINKFLRIRIAVFLLIGASFWFGFYLLHRPSIENPIDEAAVGHRTLDEFYNSEGDGKPMQIKVYYESLCPDSVNFIVGQLLRAVNEISDYINIRFVPYGKATTRVVAPGHFKFECQHGETECTGNKVHACAIAKVKDNHLLTKYITCMIADNHQPYTIGERCANKFGIEWDPISTCAKGETGSHLLQKYGEDTHSLVPKLQFIPCILVNGDRSDQSALMSNFLLKVCRLLKEKNLQPDGCKNA